MTVVERGVRGSTVAVAGLVTALAFVRGFGLHRFYDDWFYAREADVAVRDHSFLSFVSTPAAQHWSPLWNTFDYFNAWAIGWRSDVLIRSTIVVLTLIGLLVFARLAARMRLGLGATLLGIAVLGFHHLNAVAYYSFDCYSQVAADLCTWAGLSLILTDAIDGSPGRRGRGRTVAALALYVIGLLVKEQALAAMAGVTVLALWFTAFERIDADRRRTVWFAWAAMAVASVTFTVLRLVAGRWLVGDGPYQVCPSCVPGNLGIVFGAMALPIPTVYAYPALSHPWQITVTLLGAVVGGALVVGMVTLGIEAYRRADRGRRVALVVALAVVTLFPTILLAHVGELHAHTALFWYAVLVAMAAEGWTVRLRGPMPRASAAVWSVYATALFIGLQINLSEMRATGERARVGLRMFQDAVGAVPAGSVVLARGLVNSKAPTDYGLYRLTTPGMLLYEGSASLQFVAPPGVIVVDESDWDRREALPSTSFVADFVGSDVTLRPVDARRR